jgi:hypothetical protein
MLGLPGFEVLAAGDYGGELELLIESTEMVAGCPSCGVVATPHGRRDHLVRDIPSAGRPVPLVWRKRRGGARSRRVASGRGLRPARRSAGARR